MLQTAESSKTLVLVRITLSTATILGCAILLALVRLVLFGSTAYLGHVFLANLVVFILDTVYLHSTALFAIFARSININALKSLAFF